MNQSFKKFVLLCIAGFAVGALLAYLQNRETPSPAAPPVAAPVVAAVQVGGAFTLTDHNGRPATEKSWPDQYKLVFFGFTHCPDICPAALDKMTAALSALGSDAERIRPLFITVDPARDTPEVLKTYVSVFHPSIVGLTGTKEQVTGVKNAYKVYAAEAPDGAGGYMMDHSGYIYMVSPDDRLLKVFRTSDTAEILVSGIKENMK